MTATSRSSNAAPTMLRFPFEPQKTIVDGRFLITEELGEQGGMSRCYRAVQQNLERACFFKMLAPRLHPRLRPNVDAPTLFETEAKTLALLENRDDAFVQIFDRGVLHARVSMNDRQEHELDLPYYVMEWLDGQSLAKLIDACAQGGRSLLVYVVLSLCQQAARVVGIAHELGVIHRDIKPDNIFVLHRKRNLKLIDFGISTRQGARAVFGTGTAKYGAPELLARNATIESPSSDIYALGLVFFELACLRAPFECSTQEAHAYSHLHLPPPDVREFRSDVPERFAKLVAACLSKDPPARPTAKQAHDELSSIVASLHQSAEAQAQLAQLLDAAKKASMVRARELRASLPGSSAGSGTTLAGTSHQRARKSLELSIRSLPEPLQDRSRAPSDLAPAELIGLAKRDTVRDLNPPIHGVPPIIVGTPVIVEKSSEHPQENDVAAVDPNGIQDVPYVPAFRSMGAMLESMWEDDTHYQPSPFETEEMPAEALAAMLTPLASPAPARPRSSLSGVQLERGDARASQSKHESEPIPPPPMRWQTPALVIALGGISLGSLIGLAILRLGASTQAAAPSPYSPPPTVSASAPTIGSPPTPALTEALLESPPQLDFDASSPAALLATAAETSPPPPALSHLAAPSSASSATQTPDDGLLKPYIPDRSPANRGTPTPKPRASSVPDPDYDVLIKGFSARPPPQTPPKDAGASRQVAGDAASSKRVDGFDLIKDDWR